MGHQSNEATEALRAYARDLHITASRGGSSASIGASKQGDAPAQFFGSGAPHQLAIAAAVVCVVLLGGIGLAAATNYAPAATDEPMDLPSAQTASAVAVLAGTGSGSTSQAIRAFSDLGLPRAAEALEAAAGAGTDSSPAVETALAEVVATVNGLIAADRPISQDDVALSLAITELESTVWPPGLDPDRVGPSLGGIPPGLDTTWLDSVRTDGILRPTDDPILVPTKKDKTEAQEDADPQGTGRDTAPGQQKDKPQRGGGKP
jgi:hypothetical protein